LIAGAPPRPTRAYLKLREEVLEHLWRRFPSHCIVMTDPQTRRVIDLATERAYAHGFTASHEVSSWATLMVFFGAYFDDDPLWPWASGTLHATRDLPREAAIQRLFAAMNEAANPVVGATGEQFLQALLWVKAQPYDKIAADSEGSVEEAMVRWLRNGFPSKYASLSTKQLNLWTGQARARAEDFGLYARAGTILYGLLMAFLGFYFWRDPLHAWAGDALQDQSAPDPLAKTARLHRSGIAILRRYLILGQFTKGD
jgi:hypothetical protein